LKREGRRRSTARSHARSPRLTPPPPPSKTHHHHQKNNSPSTRSSSAAKTMRRGLLSAESGAGGCRRLGTPTRAAGRSAGSLERALPSRPPLLMFFCLSAQCKARTR
jgi:hypothetical protein